MFGGANKVTLPRIEAYCYYRVQSSSSWSFDFNVATVNAGDSGTVNESGSGNFTGWSAVNGNIQYEDDLASGYEQVEVSISNITGTPSPTIELYTVFVRYESDLVELVAGDYTDIGFTPLEATQADGEKPVSVARLHHLHGNHRYLYEQRGSGVITASAWPRSSQEPEDIYARAVVPSGVKKIRIWLNLGTVSGTVPGVGVEWLRVSTLNAKQSFLIVGGGPTPGWVATPIDLAVEPESVQLIKVESSPYGGTFTTTWESFSCWFWDADY
jgi:hypothetical protein